MALRLFLKTTSVDVAMTLCERLEPTSTARPMQCISEHALNVCRSIFFSRGQNMLPIASPPLGGDQSMHRGASACSHDRVDTLIVSGSMRLVYVQAAAQRSLVSLARKSTPYSSVRAFLHTVRPVFPVAALAERTVCCWSHSLL